MVIHAGKQFAFGDILDFLPQCDPFPVAQSLPSGARYVTDGVPGFIEPNLALIEGEQPDHARVLIVSAAGAVGKSTLAKALAFKLGSLFWDLAEAREVADGTLDAQLGYLRSLLRRDGLFLSDGDADLITKGQASHLIELLTEGRS